MLTISVLLWPLPVNARVTIPDKIYNKNALNYAAKLTIKLTAD